MASIVEKKFNWFEQHLRERLKERTLVSPLYKGISEAETDAFMAFYLKILLDRLDRDKANSLLEVPDTDRAEPRFGYRTSVPVPEGGISAIKTGSVPKFDIDEFIEETVVKAIKDYLAAVAINPDLSRELAQIPSLKVVTREELKSLIIPVKKHSSSLSDDFHLADYLTEGNHKFITSNIIKNIKNLHKACVLGSQVGNQFKEIFPDNQDPDLGEEFVNPVGWLKVRTGVIPLGVVPDLPAEPSNLVDLFRQGHAAQFTVESFNIEPLEKLAELAKEFHDGYYENLSNEDLAKPNLLKDQFEDIYASAKNLLNYFGYNIYNRIHAYDFLGRYFFSSMQLERAHTYLSEYILHLRDYLVGNNINVSIYDAVYSNEYNESTMYGAYLNFTDNLVRDANGNIVITTIYDPEHPTEILVDERPIILERYQSFKSIISTASSSIDVDRGVDYYWDSWQEKFREMNSYDTITSIADITPAKVADFVDTCKAFFDATQSRESNIISTIVQYMEVFMENTSGMETKVDAELLATQNEGENIFGIPGAYSIISYKGTIICYRDDF